MFAAAGLDPENPPTTWQDFIAACDALKAAGYTPIGSGLKDGYLPGWLAVYFGAQNYDDPQRGLSSPSAWRNPIRTRNAPSGSI